jgi:hypothetical protein
MESFFDRQLSVSVDQLGTLSKVCNFLSNVYEILPKSTRPSSFRHFPSPILGHSDNFPQILYLFHFLRQILSLLAQLMSNSVGTLSNIQLSRYNSWLFDKILQPLPSTTVEYSRFVGTPSDICHQMSYKRYIMKLFVELSRTSLFGIIDRENLFSIAFFSDLKQTAYLIFIFCQVVVIHLLYFIICFLS